MFSTNPVRIVTHDGSFHGDDVLAVAILTEINSDHHVIRTRDPDVIDWGDIVVDVGGIYDHVTHRYDHHMPNPPTKNDRHIYSSAGLIWKHFGRSYLKAIKMPARFTFEETTIDLLTAVEQQIRDQWIEPIDRSDNGISNEVTPISALVQAMRPINPEKSKASFDSQFIETVRIVRMMFQRFCFHAADYTMDKTQHICSTKQFLHDGKIVVSQYFIPGYRSYASTPVHFAIFPSTPAPGMEPHHIIRPIPGEDSPFPKTPIPEMLLGATGDNVEKLCGLKGVRYIHHNGFLVMTHDEESAIAFCEFCLNHQIFKEG